MKSVIGAEKDEAGNIIFYSELGDDDREYDSSASDDLYEALAELNQAHHRLDRVKQDISAFLERSRRYQSLIRRKDDLYKDYKARRNRVQELVQRLVRSNPAVEPKSVKDAYNGVGFKRSRDLAYTGNLSSAKGKTELHTWLIQHGYEKDGVFYMNVNGEEVEVPVMPVVKVTPTLPSIYT